MIFEKRLGVYLVETALRFPRSLKPQLFHTAYPYELDDVTNSQSTCSINDSLKLASYDCIRNYFALCALVEKSSRNHSYSVPASWLFITSFRKDRHTLFQ